MAPIPQPTDPRDDAVRQDLQRQSKGNPREFRDALTRAKGALPGITTGVKQWNRWDR